MAKKLMPLVKLATTFGLTALGAGPLSLLPIEALSNLLQRLIGEDAIDKLGELSGDIVGELAGESVSEFLKSLARTPDQDLRRLYLLALKEALERERDHLRRSHGERVPLGEVRLLAGDQEESFKLWLAKIDESLKDELERDLLFFKGGPALAQITGAETEDEYQELWWGFLKKTLERWNDGKPLPEDLGELLRAGLPDRVADSLNGLLADEKYAQALKKYQADFLNLILRGLSELKEGAARSMPKQNSYTSGRYGRPKRHLILTIPMWQHSSTI